MASPTGDLIQTFTNLVLDFNAAHNSGTYSNWKPYLYPTGSQIVIERVDDPGKFKTGTATDIIKYLNDSQTPQGSGQPFDNCFPQFSTDGGPQTSAEHMDKSNEFVGDVTGTGTYFNTYGNFTAGTGIAVQYTLRFKQSNGVWYLCTALVVPT